MALVACVCGARAQQMRIDGNSVNLSAARPTVPAGALRMASLTGVRAPSGFALKGASGGTFGPYAYRTGAPVGSAVNAYRLHLENDGRFYLEPMRGGSSPSLGPFDYRDGAVVTIGSNRLTLALLPSRVAGVCGHADAVAPPPVLALAPRRAALVQPLLSLRAALQALDQRVRQETADVILEGVPTVIGPRGIRRDNVIVRSRSDREQAMRSAESSAALLLERFVRDHMPLKLGVAADGAFVSPALGPGAYLLCGMVRVRDSASEPALPSRLAVWWTEFDVGRHETLRFAFSADNAIGWRSIFAP